MSEEDGVVLTDGRCVSVKMVRVGPDAASTGLMGVQRGGCVSERRSMGTTFKPNECSQQMEAGGGGMTSRCEKSHFGKCIKETSLRA